MRRQSKGAHGTGMSRPPWQSLLCAAALVAAVGCTGRPGGTTTAPSPRNVILILVDTLRANHLSLYGYPRDTSPNLRRLAARAVVFDRARSQAPCTFPSVNSLLTSRMPIEFLQRGHGNYGIPDDMPSLATMLDAQSFATFAASASAIVRATPSTHNIVGGFQRGFDVFDEDCLAEPASCINQRALAFLRTAHDPTFLYLHYMEPHAPYSPPPEYRRRFAGPYKGSRGIDAGDPLPVEHLIFKLQMPEKVVPADVRHLRDLYDDEIAYFDEQLAELFEGLDSLHLLDSTLIILASDHGEEFLEHGSFTHCRTLYDTETWTPLVMWIPGVDGKRIDAPVENLDIVPTVLDYLGVPPPSGLEGSSLRSLIAGQDPAAPRVARSFNGPMRSMNDARHKVILNLMTHTEQAYDIVADPGESRDLLADQRAARVVDDLKGRLVSWVGEREGLSAARNARNARRVEESLRSLGYLQ